MSKDDIWACVENCGTRYEYIDVESIGNEKFTTDYYKNNPSMASIKVISKDDAITTIGDDVLEHDKNGLKVGRLLSSIAHRKLKEKMKRLKWKM